MKTPIEFSVCADIVVIGQNPEMADMDNPRGDLHGFAAYVYAEDADGNRVQQYVCTKRREGDALEKAENLANALNARLALGKLPVGFSRWQEGRPAYGSKAYMQYGAADDIAWERAQEEMCY